MTQTRPSAPPSRGGRGEPGAGAQAPACRGQRRARLDADHNLLGAGRPGLAGLGRGQDRRRTGRRPGPAVRHRMARGPDARPDRADVAWYPDAPDQRDRHRPGRRAGRPRGHAWRIIARRITQPGDPVAALSADRSIRQLTQAQAAQTAIKLRPSLAGARPGSLPPADTGLLLGRLKQPGRHGPACWPPGKTPCSRSSVPARARPPRSASRTCCQRPARSWPPASAPTCGPPPPNCAPRPAGGSGRSTRSAPPPPGSGSG